MNTGTYLINGLQFDDYYLIAEKRDQYSGHFPDYQSIVLVYSSDQVSELYLSRSIGVESRKVKKKEFATLNYNMMNVESFINNFINTRLKNMDLTLRQMEKLNIVICNFLKKKSMRELYRKTKRIVFEEVLTTRRNINKATHPEIERRIINYAKNSSLQTLKLSIDFLESQNKLYFGLNKILSRKKKLFISASSKSSLLEYQLCYGLKEVIKDEKKHYFLDLINILNELKLLSPQLFRDLPYTNEQNIRKAIERGVYPNKNEKRLKSPSIKNYDNYRMFKIEHWGISFLQKHS